MNEIIANKKDVDDEIFRNIFKYQNSSFLAKDLIGAPQAKSEQLVNNVNDGLIDLRNANNKKNVPEKENPEEVVNIVEKIIHFNKQQRVKDVHVC